MSNPFLINVPTLMNNLNQPIQTLSNPPPPQIKNFSINQTSLNNNSTYFSSNNNNAVSSLNTLDGAVTISSTNGNLTVTENGNNIELTVLAGGIGVESLENLAGNIALTSTGNTVAITTVGQNINLETITNSGVSSLENLTGNIALTSTGNTVAITTVGQNINFEAVAPPLAGVASLNTLTGAINLTSTGGSVGITTVGQNLNLEALGVTPVSDWANFPAVNSVNLPDKDFNMTTSTAGIAYNKATLNANVDIGTLTNAPLRPDLNAYCGTITLGGITSPLTGMTINSVGGVSVNSGLGVSIAGGGGVAITGGGAVTVNSVGGVLVDGGGAISINGAGGISIVGGGALSIASGGILVSGGGIAVSAGGVAITAGGLNIASGVTAIGSAGIAGGGLNVYGSDISLIPVVGNTSTLKTDLITSQSGTPTLAISNVATINGLSYPPPSGAVFQGTYYKSVAQNLTNGNTDITFDLTGSWNNVGSYITHTNGTTNFTVGITGLYQLEFNASVLLNNGTWSATISRGIFIDITRPSIPEQGIIANTSLQAIANYNMQTSSTFYLIVGDVINLRINNPYTLGTPTPPQAQGVTNTFDLNTFFTWRYITA